MFNDTEPPNKLNQPNQPDVPVKVETETLDQLYSQWKTGKSPKHLGKILNVAKPIISSAIKTYAGGADVGGKAKILTLKALETYDKDKGTTLSSHIYTQLQPLRRAAAQRRNIIDIPERYTQEKNKIHTARLEFEDKYGREPADEELSDLTGLSQKRLAFLDKMNMGTMTESTLTSKDDEDGNVSLPGSFKETPENIWISYVYHDAPAIDKKILEWKTGYNGHKVLSSNEIAQRLGISPAAVSQRATKIADKIGSGININV